jgi:dTDP-4-dehydrorhamnose reductase
VKILVLGATGLLGNAVFRGLSKAPDLRVEGTIRHEAARGLFAPEHASHLNVVQDI